MGGYEYTYDHVLFFIEPLKMRYGYSLSMMRIDLLFM